MRFFIAFLALISLSLYADEPKSFTDFLELKEVVLLDSAKSNRHFYFNLLEFKAFNNNLYNLQLLDKTDIDTAFFRLTKYGDKNKEVFFSVTLSIEKFHDDFEYSRCIISDYYISDKYLLLNLMYDKSYLYLFDYDGENIKFNRYIRANDSYSFCTISNNNVVAFNSMNASSNEDKSSQTYIFTHSLESSNTEWHYFDNPSGIAYANTGGVRLIDFHSGQTAVCEGSQYKITMYNENYEPVQVLQRNLDGENPDLLTNITGANLKETAMNANTQMNQTHNTLFIKFLDANTLIVMHRPPRGRGCAINVNRRIISYYDVWKNQSGEWNLYRNDLIMYNNLDDDNFDFRHNSINMAFSFSGYNILTFHMFPFEYNNQFENKTRSEVKKMVDDYFIENDMQRSLLIRKLNLD